jgi:uncharacterized protein YegP (UPF0339 family)
MVIFKQGKNGQHYFALKAGNNETVAPSESYPSFAVAKAGADAVHKATGEYWLTAIATLIEEEAQEASEAGYDFEPRDVVSKLLTLANDNKGMQKLINRIPYSQKTIVIE